MFLSTRLLRHSMSLAFLTAIAGNLNAQVTVVNAANFRPEVSPGSYATAFAALPGVSAVQASALPFPKSLGGVSVTVDGVEAPIYFVNGSQVNLLIPYRVQPGLRPVQIKTATSELNGSVRVLGTAPGIFVQDTATPPKGAALNQDGSLNSISNALPRGQAIQIYATGVGTLSATPEDGAAAPASPIATSRSTPQVFIGGVPATVLFSGLAPGFPGLWQVNALVPNQSFLNGRVPVQLFLDGVDSNEVAIFVR